ncbi:MAG: PIN domain-containing protein [Acidobacteriota bacterium]
MNRPPLIAVDTMLFVYLFEQSPEFGQAARRVFLAAEEGLCRLVASHLAPMEVLVKPKKVGATELCRRYRHFFDGFPHLELVPVDQGVAEIASDLRASSRLRTPDAIHVATAISAKADLFVTEDQRVKAPGDFRIGSTREAIALIESFDEAQPGR